MRRIARTLRPLTLPLALVACQPTDDVQSRTPPAAQKAGPTQRTGRVVDALTGAPLPGVQVTIEGTLRTATTDADGRYQLEIPGGFGQLAFAVDHYLSASVRTGTGEVAPTARLWPAQTTVAEEDEVLDARELGRMGRDQDDIDDPDLSEAARVLMTARRASPMLSDAELFPHRTVLKGALEVPATVRVYRRGAENDSCQGRVEVLPLEEYVRGVVPHEWIPSWHIESLKAGAVAARTYAANWVVAGGKYDCADVDDTTRSQVYRDDRNARADEAVRATACEVVVRGGALVNAEYSAENSDPTAFGVAEPLCSGRALMGHGRGMCQWGTQRWADQRGQTYRWMVEHYYPGATVGNGCSDPVPDVQLRQRLARVDEEPCIDPQNTYNCADFVRQAWSVDIFDVFVGRRFELAIEVSNTGAAATPAGVALHVDLPPALVATGATIDGQAIAPGLGGAGSTIQVPVGAVPAGGMKRVGLTLRGAAISLGDGAPTPVRSWIASIDGFYSKPDYNAPPQQNEGQTFNGGDLKLLSEFDVFSNDTFEFNAGNADMAEGFEAPDRSAVHLSGGALQVPAQGVVSPFIHLDANRLKRVEARGLAGRLFWRHAGEAFDNARSARVEGVADLAEAAGWQGEIQQVRFEPDRAGALDALLFLPAGGGPGPDPDQGVEPPPPTPDMGVSTDPPPPPRRDAGPRPPRPDAGDVEGDDAEVTPVPPLPPGASGVRANSASGCSAAPAQGTESTVTWPLLAALVAVWRRRRAPRAPRG